MVISIVIAAHNEEAVLGRCLSRLLAGAEPGEFEVVVVANGCTDTTADVARAVPGVIVRELPVPSKAAALNAGDQAVSAFPRIYLDADIELTAAGVRALAGAVTGSRVLAAAPRRVLDTSGRPLAVRAYFAINGRLPAYQDALFGRGAIAVSRAGRDRFDRFPDLVADDLFLDSLFVPAEKREVPYVSTVVATSRGTADLLHRLARVRAGNAVLRSTGKQIRRSRPASWLVHVVLPRPWLLPAGVCYAALTLSAGLAARRMVTAPGWGRHVSSPPLRQGDESSRTPRQGDESSRTPMDGGVR